MKCPGFERLIDFLEGQLAEREAQTVKNHLDQGCEACMNDRGWYETLRSIVSRDETLRPAPWVRNRAFDVFDDTRLGRGTLIETARAAAHLVYDSIQRLSPAGARSGAASGRQLVYQASGYNIDIQIAAAKSGVDIAGQVLREGETGFGSVAGLLIDLTRDQREIWSTMTGNFGEFLMHEVDSGRYDLRIETRETVITIENLPVSE